MKMKLLWITHRACSESMCRLLDTPVLESTTREPDDRRHQTSTVKHVCLMAIKYLILDTSPMPNPPFGELLYLAGPTLAPDPVTRNNTINVSRSRKRNIVDVMSPLTGAMIAPEASIPSMM